MRKNLLGTEGTGCGWEAVRTSWYLQRVNVWNPFLSCALLHFRHRRLDGPCPDWLHLAGCRLLRKFSRGQATFAVITSLFHL